MSSSQADREEQLTGTTEREAIRNTITTSPDMDESTTGALSELYDVSRDGWRVLVSEHLGGHCLDLSAGFGRRSMVLAEVVDSVYAVDSDFSRLSVLDARTDSDDEARVYPIHARESALPFGKQAFDTIVTDMGNSKPTDVESQLSMLETFLAPSGTLLFSIDGWTRRTGLSRFVGVTDSTDATTSSSGLDSGFSLRPETPNFYRALAREAGFNHVESYALFPTAEDPTFVFNVEHTSAARRMIELLGSDGSLDQSAIQSALPFAIRCGLFKRVLPSYLLVCTNRSRSSEFGFEEPLLVSGRARSVVLDVPNGDLRRVWKVPNKKAHVPLTEREHSLLSYLNSRNAPVTEPLPSGSASDTRFGLSRLEDPVEGQQLADRLGTDVDSFDFVLRKGFEWLIQFQRTFRGDAVVWSAEAVRDELTFEPAGIEPPSVSGPVEAFFTPIHGDYVPQNILLQDGAVSGVVDWEYSAAEGNPLVDAGFFLLSAANLVCGGLQEGHRTILCGNNDYAAIARKWIRRYCEALDLSERTFGLFLSSAYIHRLKLDHRFGTASARSNTMAVRTDLVDYLHENRPALTVTRHPGFEREERDCREAAVDQRRPTSQGT
ncbi:phosphotransferase [Saliphagus sp. GCM10025334]